MAATIFFSGLYGLFKVFTAKTGVDPALLSIGVSFTICGVGLWFNQQWARLAAIAVLLVLGCLGLFVLVTKGIGLKRLFFFLGPVATAWWIWRDFDPRRIAEEAEETDDSKPMISMVLLLRQPRYLEEAVLAQIVSSAWGGDYATEDAEGKGQWVTGETPLFMIQSPHGMFIVNNFSVPYWNDKEAVVKEIEELRLRKAVEDHNAWLSVDLMGPAGDDVDRDAAYPYIAKLIAELGGPDCTAILQPEGMRINVWDDELVEKLRGPNALEEFARPINAPVCRVEDDDAEMKAASAEARARWPEFVEAFKKRDGRNFAVKAPITVDGNTEFIWIDVVGLEPEYIHGTLANDPVDLGNMKLGDRVEVPLKELNDWGYIRNGAPVGMFTVKVLMKERKK